MAANSIVLAFAIIGFTLAYLAVNTPEKYASLQIGNYILTYILIFFTGFLAFAFESTNESPADLLNGFNTSFSWIVVVVGAVFLIRILNNVLEATGKEVL